MARIPSPSPALFSSCTGSFFANLEVFFFFLPFFLSSLQLYNKDPSTTLSGYLPNDGRQQDKKGGEGSTM